MHVDSALIIGLGQYGRHLALALAEHDVSVMAISIDEDAVNDIAPYVTEAQIADGRNPAVLNSLGVSDFDVCFVTVGEDFQSSLEITLRLKELGAKHVVSKATGEIQEKFLLRNGADEVIFPEREAAKKAAVRFSSGNILDYIQLGDDYAIYEMPAEKDWIGRSLAQLNIRRLRGLNVLAVERKDGTILASPDADCIFEAGDKVLVLGKSEA